MREENQLRMRIILVIAMVFAANARAEDAKPTIVFLDKDAASKAIVDDKNEPYFDTLQPIEMASKTGSPLTATTLAEQRAECRARYAKAALAFTADEEALVRGVVEKIHPLIEADYPLYAKLPWTFLKLSNTIEGGFPFTRGDCIILPEDTLTQFTAQKAKDTAQKALVKAARLLVHEQLHVFQRHHPDLVAKLYTDVWGFKRAAKIESCEWLDARHLANPDGLDCRWIFPIKDGDTTRYVWPLVIFDSADKPQVMGPDIRMVAIDLEETGKDAYRVKLDDNKVPKYTDLMEVKPYLAQFEFWGEIFHPNEISAEIFSTIFLIDSLLPKHDEAIPPGLGQQTDLVRKFLRENLKTGK